MYRFDMLYQSMEYQYKEIDGIKVAYLDKGEGFPLFFIPPWTSSHVAYEGITSHLKDLPIRCIQVDLPGWGGGTKQNLKKKDFNSYVQFISDFINAFGFEKYAVLGYSLGATFILHAVSQGMIRPSKIISISGFHGRKNIMETESVLKRNVRMASWAVRLHIPSLLLKPFVGSFYYLDLVMSDVYRKNARYYMRLINSSVAADRDSVILPLMTLPDVDTEALKSFNGETLAIYNAQEPWYFKQFTEEIADMMKIKPTVVTGFRHRYFSFQPETSVSYIKEFILK